MQVHGLADFEARVTRYRGQFEESLGSYRPGLCGFVLDANERTYGVDHYGVGRVVKAVGGLPAHERVEFVCFLFMDALLDAALHSRLVMAPRSIVLGRPVFVLNTYNIITAPSANISHRNPQVMLGLTSAWAVNDIDELRRCIADHVAGTRARVEAAGRDPMQLTSNIRSLADDPDLGPVDFSGPLGLRVPPEVRDTYVAALRGA